MKRWWWMALMGVASLAHAQTDVRFDSLDRRDGAPVALTAQWFAAPGTEPAAAIVLLHGCSGMFDRQGRLDPRMREYSAMLNAAGVHALVVDSLTPRGERELCTQRTGTRAVTMTNRRRDALAALQWLAAQPRVDAKRLGLLGWSNGGSTVLAATNQHHPEVAKAVVTPAVAVAFYPGCEADLKRGFEARMPLLLLLGEADDWTPAQPCRDLAAKADGIKPELEAYAGAYHGFDGNRPVRLRKEVPNGVHPGEGVHVGMQPEARERSQQRLLRFIARF